MDETCILEARKVVKCKYIHFLNIFFSEFSYLIVAQVH